MHFYTSTIYLNLIKSILILMMCNNAVIDPSKKEQQYIKACIACLLTFSTIQIDISYILGVNM